MEEVLKTQNFQRFLNTKQNFDLMITETFNTRLFLALAYKLQIPFVTVSSSILFPFPAYDIGSPINPSYIPSVLSCHSSKMNFWERLDNVYTTLVTSFAMEYFFNAKSEEFKRKYFGEDIPPLRELAKNTSLVIINSHFTVNQPRPWVPAMIEVGGMFVKPTSKPLPQVSNATNFFHILINRYLPLQGLKKIVISFHRILLRIGWPCLALTLYTHIATSIKNWRYFLKLYRWTLQCRTYTYM